MRNLTLLFSALALSTLITTSVHAQTGSVKVNVPFPFVVANRALPAGEYVMANSDHKVVLSNPGVRSLAMILANPVTRTRKTRPTGQVIFQCYLHQCFLSEVWAPGQEVGSQLLRSRMEAAVARHESPTYFALLGNAE